MVPDLEEEEEEEEEERPWRRPLRSPASCQRRSWRSSREAWKDEKGRKFRKDSRKKSIRKQKSQEVKESENRSLPGSHRHLPFPVALGGDHLATDLHPGALGQRSLARNGLGRRRLVLAALEGELLKELSPNFGLRRDGALHDLWVGVG
jgi:hypothetical protein